jgi:glutamine amidotransferase
MIGIVAYGVGNVRAFARIYERHGIPVTITADPEALQQSTHLVLPGVGAFDAAMARLKAKGLYDVLNELVLERRRPVLGVCVGMQMMLGRSDEGQLEGLGWIPGDVRRLDAAERLPHMGWNDIQAISDPLFEGIPAGSQFYFLHSYHAAPSDAGASIARTEYGGRFVCAVRRNHIAGVQFHPEKSHQWGDRLLVNFARS